MQIQYQCRLLEPTLIKPEDVTINLNYPIDQYTLLQSNHLNPIEYVVCGPLQASQNTLALYYRISNQILLIDTKNQHKIERFPLKSCDKRFTKQSFTIKGLDFSPDGSRLALGQTDCIIYIYKIPSSLLSEASNQSTSSSGSFSSSSNSGANNKPVISGKFVCSSPVTCLIWTEFGIIFGTKDGKIKLITMITSNKQQQQQQQQQQSSNNETSNLTSVSPEQKQQQTPKVINLFNSPRASMPISLACKFSLIAIGFVDCSVYLINVANLCHHLDQISDPLTSSESSIQANSRRNSSQVPTIVSSIEHSCPVDQMILIQSKYLCCSGSNGKISFYNLENNNSNDSKLSINSTSCQIIELEEEITSIDYSSMNEIMAITTRNRILFIMFNQESRKWQLQASCMEFGSEEDKPGARKLISPRSLTCIRWIKDGSQLIIGLSDGSLELFRCDWNKQSVGEQFDICHIAKNRVRITDRKRNLLATYKTKYNIKKVNLLNEGRNVLIWTTGSLLLTKLSLNLYSEIEWKENEKSSKFYFHRLDYVFIYNQIRFELSVVKLGQDSILFRSLIDNHSLTKDQISVSNLIKLNIKSDLNESNQGSSLESDQLLAFLGDSSKVLYIIDLQTGKNFLSIDFDFPIKWLDFNHSGNYLAINDTQSKLHLLKITTNKDHIRPVTVLGDCSFVTWLPETDILLAQSSFSIYICYKIDQSLKRATILDSRNYNINNHRPIIDLSCVSSTGSRLKTYPRIINLIDKTTTILLSNGFNISLDNLYISLHKELINSRLESAIYLLDKDDGLFDSHNNRRNKISLWASIGWKAIESQQCKLAIRAFKEINYQSMIDYLQDCLNKPIDGLEWRLAKLKGDWDTFENLQEPDVIISTYKRLNKWHKCIEYLTKSQQFRQRDLAEQEFSQWLIDNGRYLEAAKIQAKQMGDLKGAIELLMSKSNYRDAAELLIKEQKCPTSSSQVNELKDQLLNGGEYALAATISRDILKRPEEALELYLKGKVYREALKLADLYAKDRLDLIRIEFAKYLVDQYRSMKVSKRVATQSIDLYQSSGCIIEALEASIELDDNKRALDILNKSFITIDEGNRQMVEQLTGKLVANLLEENQRTQAIEALLLSKQYKKVVELYLESKQFDEAFKVSMKYINNDNRTKTIEEFREFANIKGNNLDLEARERIYLLIGDIDSAVEMHKKSANYDRIISILKQYQPDSLESTMLLLAKEFEQNNRLDEAERFMLLASEAEWTNVVRMYRLANRWDQAYRVAKMNCFSDKDPLLVQLAYFWSKSIINEHDRLSKEEAKQLLDRLNCRKEVIEFSCENSNFVLAIDLCQEDSDERKQIVRKYAKYLEKRQDLSRAEEILMNERQFKDAARMYIDNDLYSDAVRVIEAATKFQQSSEIRDDNNRPVEMMNETLIECANRIASQVEFDSDSNYKTDVEKKKLNQAQQMYLRAQRPELAVEMYKSRALWQEAIQLAQRFAPHLLEDLEKELDAQVNEDLGPIINGATNSSQASIYSAINKKNEQNEAAEVILDTSDFFQSKAEQSIRRGADLKTTRRALGKFLNNLSGGDSENEATCLVLGENLAQLERQQASINEPEFARRALVLADRIFQSSCPLLAQHQQQDESSTLDLWQRLRNLLAKLVLKSKDTHLVEQCEHRFQATHYVILHRCLAQTLLEACKFQLPVLGPQSAERLSMKLNSLSSNVANHIRIGILSKLSMSLLRYTDILDARLCFLSAGFWLLATNKHSFARLAWCRLIELIDGDERRRFSRQLAQAEIPEAGSRDSSSINERYPTISEIRSWLIESLLENRVSFELQLDQDGHFESSLRGGQLKACLLTGYPVFRESSISLGSSRLQVRPAEWDQINQLVSSDERALNLSNEDNINKSTSITRSKGGLRLSDCIEFMKQLSKLNK